MTEEERILGWLQRSQRDLPPPEPDRLLIDVLAIVRETPQLGRRGLRRTHGSRWRILMLNPIRIAAVLAIALGTATVTTMGPGLIQQSPPASALPSPSAVPLPDPTKATTVTGQIVFGPESRASDLQSALGVVRSWGASHRPSIVTISDPRLDGDAWISWQHDDYVLSDGTRFTVGTGTWRIETEDGAWQGSYPRVEIDGGSDRNTAVLTGEGAYEGLTVVWEQTLGASGWDIVGVIIEGPPPPTATLP
jgi:hypothetical protein